MTKQWYVDEYQIGYDVILRNGASLERWPVSHGPFKSEEEAHQWAKKELAPAVTA